MPRNQRRKKRRPLEKTAATKARARQRCPPPSAGLGTSFGVRYEINVNGGHHETESKAKGAAYEDRDYRRDAEDAEKSGGGRNGWRRCAADGIIRETGSGGEF